MWGAFPQQGTRRDNQQAQRNAAVLTNSAIDPAAGQREHAHRDDRQGGEERDQGIAHPAGGADIRQQGTYRGEQRTHVYPDENQDTQRQILSQHGRHGCCSAQR
ncbi:unknown [Klebsiella variicola CAG:634]|nr:unknown [Klebsiella variicola CAG:634]